MPMKKFSLFAIAAWFAAWVVSCSAPEQVTPAEAPEVPVAYVTVPDRSEEVTEAAVRSVAALFGADDATRAGEREIESVHTLRSQSGDALCYVVNYRDDRGFVVVSATKDYMPVLAYGDEGRFDVDEIDKTGVSVWLAEQQAVLERAAELPDSVRLRCRAMWEAYNTTREPLFSEAETRSYDDVMYLISSSVSRWEAEGYTVHRLSDFKTTYEFQQLPAEVQDRLLMLPLGYANPNYGGREHVSFVIIKTNNIRSPDVGPLMNTRWDQGSIYFPENDYNQALLPLRGYLGCTTVAMGQIMKYHRYPASYLWDAMADDHATPETSGFLVDVGRAIGIKYEEGESGATRNQVAQAFKSYGYAAVTIQPHNHDALKNELMKYRPVYSRGTDLNDGKSGHAWVYDGVRTTWPRTELKLMTLEDCPSSYEPQQFTNPYNYSTDGSSYTMFHVNWGWGGTSNGYYQSGQTKLGNYDFAIDRCNIVNIYPTK